MMLAQQAPALMAMLKGNPTSTNVGTTPLDKNWLDGGLEATPTDTSGLGNLYADIIQGSRNGDYSDSLGMSDLLNPSTYKNKRY